MLPICSSKEFGKGTIVYYHIRHQKMQVEAFWVARWYDPSQDNLSSLKHDGTLRVLSVVSVAIIGNIIKNTLNFVEA